MPEYAFTLAKWSQRDKHLRCPNCGKTGYKVYVDANGNDVDPDGHICGKCDHENSCGYHLNPKEFYRMNPEARRSMAEATPRVQPQMKRIEIDQDKVLASAKCYDQNVLVRWLKSLPIRAERRAMIDGFLGLYFVGTAKGGGTIWWQVDSEGVVRTGKKMIYCEDGHRLKDADGNSIGFNWIHAMMRKQGHFPESEYDLVQCLFGEHLLKRLPEADVHLVESEKTALLMAIIDQDSPKRNVWVACGGKQNLGQVLQAPLTGRKLTIYPDKDAFDGPHNWPDAVRDLGIKCAISDAALRASLPEDGPKCDIADIALRRMSETKEATLAYMKQRNENVQLLIDRLQLTNE